MKTNIRVLYNAECPICNFEIKHYQKYTNNKKIPIQFDDLNSSRLAHWNISADLAARNLSAGRVVNHSVTAVESSICQLAVGSNVQFLLVPAEQFPSQTWPLLLDHTPIVIVTAFTGDVITEVQVNAAGADSRRSMVSVESDVITTVLAPTPRMIIAGIGPFAEALAAQAALLNWKVVVEARPDAVAGLAATLSSSDAIVVMGHEVEKSSGCLMAALASEAGYVGALGSQSMQQSRADWLAYRDVVDLSRVHGPAGLDIGAKSPQEVAVAIAAEAIATI